MKSDLELFCYVFEQITTLEEYIAGVNEEDFLGDSLKKDACLMKLLVIGEYSHRISDEQKSRFSDIEWQLLKAARNYYAHAYGAVSWLRVWETLKEDMPRLKARIQNIIAILEKENNGKTN